MASRGGPPTWQPVTNEPQRSHHGVQERDGEPEDATDYLAVHHAARAPRDLVERAVRKARSEKLKFTSQFLLKPNGLTLLAKQCRQLRMKQSTGNEGLLATRIIQMYDMWANQLCPGYDLDVFYSKLEKMGNERTVKEQTEALIATRKGDLDVIQLHTQQTNIQIAQERQRAINRRLMVDDDDDDDDGYNNNNNNNNMAASSVPHKNTTEEPQRNPVQQSKDNLMEEMVEEEEQQDLNCAPPDEDDVPDAFGGPSGWDD